MSVTWKRFVIPSLALLIVSSLPAVAAELEKPRRRPQGGGLLQVSLSVPWSGLQLKSGNQANYSGELWYERLVGKKFRGSCSMQVEDDRGRKIALPDIDMQIDADVDPAGEAEPIRGARIDDDIVFRALATSDLGLLPTRLVIPHLMAYDGSSKTAVKEVEIAGATVEMYETRLGAKRLHGAMCDIYFTRTIRRLQPSGFEVHDFVLTCEDGGEGVVVYGTGMRLLVHATQTLPSGEKPPSGVFHLALFSATQQEWLSGDAYIADRDKTSLDDKYRFGLENALFTALKTEGVGDPFDSPAAFALEYAELLDDRAVTRLINLKSAKILAITAPILVEARLSYDPATHLKYWKRANDPVERLLLAAGAAAGGASEAAFTDEANLALNSTDPVVLNAVLVLAKALNDPLLIAEAEKKSGKR